MASRQLENSQKTAGCRMTTDLPTLVTSQMMVECKTVAIPRQVSYRKTAECRRVENMTEGSQRQESCQMTVDCRMRMGLW